MRRARSPARSSSTPAPNRSASAGGKKGWYSALTRLGLNAGPAIVGNFGGGRYFDYTAYGDTVNMAARLEAANKQLGTRICVGESVAARVPGFKGRPVGDLVLRGRREPLRAFEPLSEDAYDDPATRAYLDAFGKLEAGDPTAPPAFAALLGPAQRRPAGELSSETSAERRHRRADRARLMLMTRRGDCDEW